MWYLLSLFLILVFVFLVEVLRVQSRIKSFEERRPRREEPPISRIMMYGDL